MRKFYSCFLVTLCFWLLAFFGPMLVMLWNNVGYAVTCLLYTSDAADE